MDQLGHVDSRVVLEFLDDQEHQERQEHLDELEPLDQQDFLGKGEVQVIIT